MARIPRETVEAIRDRVDIVEVVSRHVKVQRRGGSYVGLCPFHQEKTPSFHVIPHKAMYHCFGCQSSGDAFRFLMEIEGLSFVEAVKELAGPAGVTIETRTLTPAERRALQQRATLYDVLEAAARFYEKLLWTAPEGEVARRYLERRDITTDTAREARLGWAPGGWTRLVDHLHAEGISASRLEEAGLAKPGRSGGHYDAFRERVVIPILDERGRVIAFGGRLLEGDGPKYINSPETRLYEKSQVLYGLDAARRAVGQRDRLILVEGYFDVLSMRQAGFAETVATCGTSLTPEHVQRIQRLTRTVVVLLDADEAGSRAAERTLPLFDKAGIAASRLQIPDAKDPDDYLREHGAEAMEQVLGQSEPLLPWVVGRKMSTYGYTAAGKARARDEITEALGGLSAAHIAELAPVLRLPESDLASWARQWTPPRVLPPDPMAPDEPPPRPAGWKPQVDVVHLLWLLVHRYAQVADLVRRADPRVLAEHAEVKPAVARLLQGEAVTSILDDEPDDGVRRTLAAVVARPRLYTENQSPAAVVEVLARLFRPVLEAAIAGAHDDAIQRARQDDPDGAREAHARRHVFTMRKRTLEQALDAEDLQLALEVLAREPDEGDDISRPLAQRSGAS